MTKRARTDSFQQNFYLLLPSSSSSNPPTFLQLSQATAASGPIISISLLVIVSKGSADSLPIGGDFKNAKFPHIHQEVDGEVVGSISTRGNCEDSCCSVVPVIQHTSIETQDLTERQLHFFHVYCLQWRAPNLVTTKK